MKMHSDLHLAEAPRRSCPICGQKGARVKPLLDAGAPRTPGIVFTWCTHASERANATSRSLPHHVPIQENCMYIPTASAPTPAPHLPRASFNDIVTSVESSSCPSSSAWVSRIASAHWRDKRLHMNPMKASGFYRRRSQLANVACMQAVPGPQSGCHPPPGP